MDDHAHDPDQPSGPDRPDEPPATPIRLGLRPRSLSWAGPAFVATLLIPAVALALPHRALPPRPSVPRGLVSSSPKAAIVFSPAPTAVPASTTPAPSDVADGPWTATDDGLTMTVEMDGTSVEAGRGLVVKVTIENARSEPVILGLDGCGAPAAMQAQVAPPLEPVGRTWNGPAQAFKDFALATGGNGTPVADPRLVFARPPGCRQGPTEVALPPGTAIDTTLTWTADVVNGVPALPGEVPFTIRVSHDPPPRPTPSPCPFRCCVGSYVQTYEELTIDGMLSITGGKPGVLTAGQAVDALLADQRFRAWFARQPASTWSVANLFLENDGPAGIIPAGPSWEIDLFREVGVPRNWAIAFIDPFEGSVRQLQFCNDPCDR